MIEQKNAFKYTLKTFYISFIPENRLTPESAGLRKEISGN